MFGALRRGAAEVAWTASRVWVNAGARSLWTAAGLKADASSALTWNKLLNGFEPREKHRSVVARGFATTGSEAEGKGQEREDGRGDDLGVLDTSGFAGRRGEERLYHVNGIDFPVTMEEILTGEVELPEDFDVETHFGSWEEGERPQPDLVRRVSHDVPAHRDCFARYTVSAFPLSYLAPTFFQLTDKYTHPPPHTTTKVPFGPGQVSVGAPSGEAGGGATGPRPVQARYGKP
mmetsp:Transcript_4515/g.13395  ORF Transcript_4515/g.13395 Transcript_4515/m.13395 type:complete len:233 (-) Transcript_4515:2290-2988(-)